MPRITPSQTPRITRITPIQTPRTTRITPSQTPRITRITLIQTPRITRITPIQTPRITRITPRPRTARRPRTTRHTLIALMQAAALVLLAPLSVCAQQDSGDTAPHAGTLEIGGGLVWSRGYDAGRIAATETRNTTGGAGPLTLFETDSQVLSTTGVGAQVGVYLSRRISAEGVFQYSRPILRTRISSDFENAETVDADGELTSYMFGGSVLYHFGDGRLVPFVSGGGGYLRQLHEDNAELLTSTEIHAGAGVKLWLGSGRRRIGLRLDAQASSRSKAVAFEQKRRTIPTVGAGLTLRF